MPLKTLLNLAPPNHTASPLPSPCPSLPLRVKRARKKQQQLLLSAPGTCGQRDQQGFPGPHPLGTLQRRMFRLQHSCVCSRSLEGSTPCSPFLGTKRERGFASTIRNTYLRLRCQGIQAEVAGRYRGLLGGASCLVPRDPGRLHSTGNGIKIQLTLRRELIQVSWELHTLLGSEIHSSLLSSLSSNPETAPSVIHLLVPSISSHTPLTAYPHSRPQTHQTLQSSSILSTLIPPCLYTCASWCL